MIGTLLHRYTLILCPGQASLVIKWAVSWVGVVCP